MSSATARTPLSTSYCPLFLFLFINGLCNALVNDIVGFYERGEPVMDLYIIREGKSRWLYITFARFFPNCHVLSIKDYSLKWLYKQGMEKRNHVLFLTKPLLQRIYLFFIQVKVLPRSISFNLSHDLSQLCPDNSVTISKTLNIFFHLGHNFPHIF